MAAEGLAICVALSGVGAQMPNLPFTGSGGLLFQLGLGYAILTIIPKTAEMIRDALKIPAFKYGSAFGEALGPITTPIALRAEAEAKRAGNADDAATAAGIAEFLRNAQRGRI